MGTDHPQISLAYLPPTPRQTRIALACAGVLLLGLAVLIPFAAKPLPRISGFITAFDAVISVTDLITASLLLAHFSITRSRALRALACGYLFSAAIVVVHGLTFPGVISPTGNIGGSLHTNFRIYLLWHLGLPVALFAYIWLRDKGRTKAGVPTPTEIVAIVGIVGVLALLSCIGWLTLLPPVDPVAGRWLTVITMMICAAALSLLWLFKRSALDQWLMVVVLAMIVELAITALIGGRGPRIASLGFYIGRLFSLVTSTVVLTALLAETTRLYAGVAHANMLASAVKDSQTLSGEIELPKLMERLMTIAIEKAGAERGLLILRVDDEYLGQAEARRTGDQVEVALRQGPINGISCPESLVRHVIRTRERVILDDASKPNLFSGDDYLHDRRSKSILCLPLIKQSELTGILLLENALTSHAFTLANVGLLELLAGQAAISLENAALYTDLQLQVGLLQHLPVSAWTLKPNGTPDFVNQVWLEFSGQTLDFVRSRPEAWMAAVHPEDREMAAKSFWEGVHSGQHFAFETRSLRAQDKTYRRHLQQTVVLRDAEGKVLKFVGTTTDIDDQKRAEEALRQAQSDLARINRVTTMGELTASLAHEISQPISAVVSYAYGCLRFLDRDKPDLDAMRMALAGIVGDGQRATQIIGRIRSQFEKGSVNQEILDVSEIIRETVALLRSEAVRYSISARTELAADLPQIFGDRVQLQQVAMNLIVNSIEAMKDVDGIREMVLKSQRAENNQLLVSVSDTGIGFPPQLAEQIFDPFFTTKPHGTGMGLRISRSIVESHGGRLWADASSGRGVTFYLSLPSTIAANTEYPPLEDADEERGSQCHFVSGP
ncbi:ATP-binding protein [Granulicella sp. S190]|uniref:ATP-binding protein n=1 Tax=Granulicella sp. S190 TaxID=1747226 RepID=UPI00131B5D77|nr:ATP-binding protein [Granulicella sp. S190]